MSERERGSLRSPCVLSEKERVRKRYRERLKEREGKIEREREGMIER